MSKKMKGLLEMVDVLSIAIAREQASVKFYTEAQQKAQTETIQRMFSLLLEQEKGHEAKLTAQLHEVRADIELEKLRKK
jgi:rubrerythrin